MTRRSFRAVGGLAGVNAAVLLLTFVSGPLLARYLGPEGRGDLAAVLVVAGSAPIIASFGLNAFVATAVASGQNKGPLLGTALVLSCCFGVLGWLAAWPVASAISQGRTEVFWLIVVCFGLLPLSIVTSTLAGAVWGEQDWRRFAAVRLIPPTATLLGYLALAATSTFSVSAAASVVLVSGAATLLALGPVARYARPLTWSRQVARNAISFGSRANIAVFASQGNARVDQLLMAGLVAPAQLGHYAVAMTVAGVSSFGSQAVNTLVLPRVASGEARSVALVVKACLAATVVSSLAISAIAPIAVPAVFGASFEESVMLVQILSVGFVFSAGNNVLNGALTGAGYPGQVARAEIAALAVTIPLLLTFLPTGGATAAAIISGVTFAVDFVFLLWFARSRFPEPVKAYVVPTLNDVATVRIMARSLLRANG